MKIGPYGKQVMIDIQTAPGSTFDGLGAVIPLVWCGRMSRPVTLDRGSQLRLVFSTDGMLHAVIEPAADPVAKELT